MSAAQCPGTRKASAVTSVHSSGRAGKTPAGLPLSVCAACQPPHPSFSLFHVSFPGVLLKAKVGFPAKEAHSGSTVQLRLQAAPGSLCAVQAVDENMFFVRPESELTSQMVSVCATRQKNTSDG